MARQRPQFNQVNIVSGDLDASIAFYRRLGVDIPDDEVWETESGTHHANAGRDEEPVETALDLDSATFAAIWNKGWQGRSDLKGKVVVGFRVATRDAVDRIYGAMTSAGHPGLMPPHDAFWGARYAILEDPDGVAVGLMSPMSDEHRSLPPDV